MSGEESCFDGFVLWIETLVIVEKQIIRVFVLNNIGETADLIEKSIIGIFVACAAYLPNENWSIAFFTPELMIHVVYQAYRLTRAELNSSSRRASDRYTVYRDLNILIGQFLVAC